MHAHRTFEQVQTRGRWASAHKPGRLLMEASKLLAGMKMFSDIPLSHALGAILS